MSFNKKDEQCDLSNLRYVNNFNVNNFKLKRVEPCTCSQNWYSETIIDSWKFSIHFTSKY